jgi:hypothetical protein
MGSEITVYVCLCVCVPQMLVDMKVNCSKSVFRETGKLQDICLNNTLVSRLLSSGI